jgi:lysyl-tRNA synthetase class 2
VDIPYSSNQLRQVREDKLKKIQAITGEAYPRKAHTTHSLVDFIKDFQSLDETALQEITRTVSIMGRIVSLRDQGKTIFLHLFEGGVKVQVYLRKDALSDLQWELMHLVDLGDFISVEGTLMRTKTGELTLRANTVTFLAKALLPLPEKWHGLQDIEIRYRQRYLDLISDEEVFKIFEQRSRLVASLRIYMNQLGYLEVETPMMHSIPGGATARPFVSHHNALDVPLYLRIAPELFLKRLIIGGFRKVFEINRNFRNEGLSTRHNPEFTMMESYAAGEDLRDMMNLLEGLIRFLAQQVTGKMHLPWGDISIDYESPFRRMTLRESLISIGGFSEEEVQSYDFMKTFCASIGVSNCENKSIGLLQFYAFENRVESRLVQPTFITDYPVEVSPLTKLIQGSDSIVDRFELFIGGMELANAYSELNDPIDQLKRLEIQSQDRDKGDEEAMHIDHEFVTAMEHGMPPAGGQGLGIDRLVMLLTNQTSIRDVILFPLMRPLKANEDPLEKT